jgi:F420-dependent oxidoreductase-like protein
MLMLEIALMIEGQDGVNWPRWQRLARITQDAGFSGIFRSDHFTNPAGPHLDALELWASQTWLASHTSRIEFGPLVSPVSFRHPVMTAWMASAVDDLSDGRFRLGLGAGWQEREHAAFGFDLLDVERRFARFTEALEVVTRLLRSDDPVSFDGEFYQLREAQLLPRPRRPGGPPIVIGGNGPRRTLPLVARYADEWNAVGVTPARFTELNARLDELLREHGRAPTTVRRTLMTRVVFGRDASEVAAKLRDTDEAGLRERGALIGGSDQIREHLRELEAVGVQCVMLQWLDGLDDIAGIEALARAIIPAGG